MTSSTKIQDDVDVVIVGGGPAGLTLACDLARRGVSFRIIEKSVTPFNGSRGKGIQPRTIEVFDDLGIAQPLLQAGSTYPPMKVHLAFLGVKWHMIKLHQATPDVPYPNVWLVPQWRTEEVLRNRLAQLGRAVEFGVEAKDFEQDEHGVTVHVEREGVPRSIRARYVVGADGGRSFVRKKLGVQFIGTTTQEGRMIVGDLRVDGLDRSCWHVWPTLKGGMIGLCPLPHSDLFQLMMKLDASEGDPELSEQAIQARWMAATGLKKIHLHNPRWLSVFRPNVRLVERYRVGRVFLAGDAAHVHTPAGAQGLNTGVQDGYNLGWKLAAVLHGAPEALLDTYEEERMPVAANVLELSSKLYKTAKGGSLPKATRGDQERQLKLNYRSSSIALNAGGTRSRKVQAGDRAPDAPCSCQQSGQSTLFDAFRGEHFTVLAFGAKAIEAVSKCRWSNAQGVETQVRVSALRTQHVADDATALVDEGRHARMAYGVADDENVTFLIRPDGYVGHIANQDWVRSIDQYLTNVVGFHLIPQHAVRSQKERYA